jgi:hypothetical protein
MADQIKYQDTELEGVIQRMLDAGESHDSIDAVIKTYDEEKHPIRSAISGGLEGVANAAVGVLRSPYDLPKAVIGDTIDVAHGDTPKNAKALVEGMANLPKQWSDGSIRDKAEMVGSAVGSVGLGAGAGKLLPTSLPIAARGVGKAFQYAGEHPFATRMSGGAGIVAGVATGRPELIVGGLAAQAVPAIATKTGQALRIWGGESPAVVRLGKPGVAKLNSQFDEAMVKRGMNFHDEQAAAGANATNLQNIENLKAGRTASETSVRESVSATRPNGSKSSASRSFDAPDHSAADKLRMRDEKVQASMDKLVAEGKLRPNPAGPGSLQPSGRVPGGIVSAPAPSIRVLGKAAQDLQDGKGVPTASVAPLPSNVRLEELAGRMGGQADQLPAHTPAGPTRPVAAPVLSGEGLNLPAQLRQAPQTPVLPEAHMGTPPELLTSTTVKPARVVTQDAIAASKSRSPMSKTPGLTRSDLEAAGLNPDLNYKDMTPEMVDRIKSMRSSRHGTHYANAQTDKAHNAGNSELRSILEESLLMRQHR